MSYSDEESYNDEPVKRSSKSTAKIADEDTSSSSSNAGLIAGIAVAGVAIAAAVGARLIFNKKPKAAPKRSSASRSQGRKKVPPRRARSTTSGGSLPQSPTSSSSNPTFKTVGGASPKLPVRKAGTRSTPKAAPSAGAAAPAAAAAAATVAAATAAAVATIPEAAQEEEQQQAAPYAEPDAAELKEAADAAIEKAEAAVAAGDYKAASQAVEQLEDAAMDQIALSNEQAVEAVMGLVEAAEDANEAAEEAEEVIAAHAQEQEQAEEPAPAPAAAAPAAPKAEKKSAKPSLPPKKKAPAPKPAAPEPKKQEEKAVDDAPSPSEASSASEPSETAAAVAPEGADPAEIPEFLSAKPLPDESDDMYESLDTTPHPTLNFDQAPTVDAPLTEMEEKVRQMSLTAHNFLATNPPNFNKALKEQAAAMDYCLEEGAGKIRPALVLACSFALADMLVALRKVNETKVALATAYDAAQHVENKAASIRALMNYAYVLKSEPKPRSTRNCYETALEIAHKEFGVAHPQIETVKIDYAKYLTRSGRVGEAIALLTSGAEALLAEGDRLEKEGPAEAEKPKEEEKKEADAQIADPGTGMEHLDTEEQTAAEEGASLPPHVQARHMAMRNLMTAGSYLSATGKVEEAETTLNKALEIAIQAHGENSVPHMNILYAIGAHFKAQSRTQDAINAYEHILSIMDETIEVYEPELLQFRVTVLRDTALLYDQLGEMEVAIDYATGALVNAKTLAGIMAQIPGAPRNASVNMVEPFLMLLADLKHKAGDTEGAAEARREALRGKLNQGIANNRGSRQQPQRSSSSGALKRNATGGATRAGGRRV